MKIIFVMLLAFGLIVLVAHRPPVATISKAELKSFAKPDEVREFPKGRVELVNIGGATVGRATFQPGWKWSTSVQPLSKKENSSSNGLFNKGWINSVLKCTQ